MPPSVPPRPARYSHNTAPRLSGSSAHACPDFCPTTIASLLPAPLESLTSIGESPRSKSGPMSALFEAQLPAAAGPTPPGGQPTIHTSLSRRCELHLILPLSRSIAITASLVGCCGSVYM